MSPANAVPLPVGTAIGAAPSAPPRRGLPAPPSRELPVASRRTLLAWGGAALVSGALAGCGVRREPAGPALPLVAPRAVDPRAATDYAELRIVRAAGTAATRTAGAGGAPAAVAAELVTLHAAQAEVLSARLRELGEDPADEARLAGAAPSGAPSPAGRDLPAAEAAGLSPADLTGLDRIAAAEAPLVLSLRVQRAVALPLVGGSAPAWTTPAVATPAEAARLVGVMRAAEYGLSVATARMRPAGRAQLAAPLEWVSAVRLVLEPQAGGTRLEVPTGYALPFPVTDDDSALRLGRELLGRVTDGVLAGVPAAEGNAAGLLAALALASVAEDQARRLGAALRPFPGLLRR